MVQIIELLETIKRNPQDCKTNLCVKAGLHITVGSKYISRLLKVGFLRKIDNEKRTWRKGKSGSTYLSITEKGVNWLRGMRDLMTELAGESRPEGLVPLVELFQV